MVLSITTYYVSFLVNFWWIDKKSLWFTVNCWYDYSRIYGWIFESKFVLVRMIWALKMCLFELLIGMLSIIFFTFVLFLFRFDFEQSAFSPTEIDDSYLLYYRYPREEAKENNSNGAIKQVDASKYTLPCQKYLKNGNGKLQPIPDIHWLDDGLVIILLSIGHILLYFKDDLWVITEKGL